jgi:hypothetical protein
MVVGSESEGIAGSTGRFRKPLQSVGGGLRDRRGEAAAHEPGEPLSLVLALATIASGSSAIRTWTAGHHAAGRLQPAALAPASSRHRPRLRGPRSHGDGEDPGFRFPAAANQRRRRSLSPRIRRIDAPSERSTRRVEPPVRDASALACVDPRTTPTQLCLLRELVGEHFHQETVVPGTDFARARTSASLRPAEPDLLVRPDRGFVSHAGIANGRFHG